MKRSAFQENKIVQNTISHQQSLLKSPTSTSSKKLTRANPSLCGIVEPIQADENQMKLALEVNIKEKQDNIDKMQMYIQKLNFELQSKIERSEYLRIMYDSKSVEIDYRDTEQTLKREIQEVAERLEILSHFTKREKFSQKQHKEKNSYKIEQLSQKLTKMEREKTELEIQSSEFELQIQNLRDEKTAKLFAALRPFEEAKVEIQQQYQIFQSRVKVCEQHKERKEQLYQVQIQEETKVIEDVQGLEDENERLRTEMEIMREQHMDEYDIFEKEYQEEKELRQIIKEKQKLEDKQTKIEKLQKKIKEEIEKIDCDKSYQSQLKEVNKGIKECYDFEKVKRNSEIQKVEHFLRNKEQDLQVESLVIQVMKNSNAEGLIKQYQIHHLQQQIQQVNIDFNEENILIEQELQDLRSEIENNDENEQTMKWMNEKYNHTLEKQKELRFLTNKKIKMINQLINEYSSHNENQEIKEDLNAIKNNYLNKVWQRMHSNDDERQNFKKIVDLYVDRLQQREKILCQLLNQRTLIYDQIAENQQKIQQKRIQYANNSEEQDKLKVQIKELTKQEKQISKSLEERQTQIEFQLFKFGERNFEEYYAKHETLFEGVKKTYGKKVCDKMKTEQKREFISITVDQYKRRIKDLKDRQQQIEENNQKVIDQQKKQLDIIQVELHKKQEDLHQQSNELKLVEFQLRAIVDALCEIDREMENLQNQKQLEIKKTISTLCKQKNYENQKARLASLTDEIDKKSKLLQKLKNEIEDKESNVYEKTTNYKAEDAQLKVRYENLKRAQIELQKQIKPQIVQMEREVKELCYQINIGRKKLEGMFDKYQQLQQQLALAKKTMKEKFNVEYDQENQTQRQFLDTEEEAYDSESIPKISTQGFQFDEEFKKMQNVIEADEKIKSRPISSQIIHEISEEYDDEKSETNLQFKAFTTGKKQSSKKIDDSRRIDQNMQELLMMSTDKSHISYQSQIIVQGENFIEISTINNERFIIDIQGCTQVDYEFFSKIKPLLEGEEIYKKFGTTSSMTQKPFDPLELQVTPEQKGFGKRFIKLSSDLNKLEFFKSLNQSHIQGSHSQSNINYENISNQSNSQGCLNIISTKPLNEGSINLDKVMKLVIPSVTQDVIKYQKLGKTQACNNEFTMNKNNQKLIGIKREQEEYKEKCIQAKYYSFTLILDDKTLEFVCSDYIHFKLMTEALEEIIKVSKKGNLSNKAKRIQLNQ